MKRVLFRLSMPSTGSWNGRWSGEGRNYVIVRRLNDEELQVVFEGLPNRSWFHSWSDGWAARVDGRLMASGERTPKSDGFCGYDWMVDNIIRLGLPS